MPPVSSTTKRRLDNAEVMRGRMLPSKKHRRKINREKSRVMTRMENQGADPPTYEAQTRDVQAGELRVGRRALKQEMSDLTERSPNATRPGGIPIIGPIRYPTGPRDKGSGIRTQAESSGVAPGGAISGGFPPGLRLPPPPVPFYAAPSKRQARMQNTPSARLSA